MKLTKEDIKKYGTEEEIQTIYENSNEISDAEKRLIKHYPEIMEYFIRLVNVAHYTNNDTQKREELANLVGDILTYSRKR